MKMKLVENNVRTFHVAKVFKGKGHIINSIDFFYEGDALISCSEDDEIAFYDCENGTLRGTINSKKYGVDLIHFTHIRDNAIHSSTKIDDTIRYLSLVDNKYIRYFPGHSSKVVSLCVSPTDNTFLSASLDKTIRLWDLRSPNCHGLLHLSGNPLIAYDPYSLIFAAGVNSECIKLYDLRSFDKAPFSIFNISTEYDWTGIKFSYDCKTILISTNGSIIQLIDAFHGMCLWTFTGHLNNNNNYNNYSNGIDPEASFSPDSQFIFTGSPDGYIHIWNAESGQKVCVLNTYHSEPAKCVQFNPKLMMFASAYTNMSLWIPVEN